MTSEKSRSTNPHLADTQLVALARRADSELPSRASRHLASCARCRALLSDFRILREQVRGAAAGPDQSLLARVFALAERRPPTPRTAARFLLARLLHDSGPQLHAAGIRAASATREQSWRIPGANVDIRIQSQGLGSPGVLHGQVFPLGGSTEDAGDGAVWLVQRGRRSHWAPLSDEGEFELPAPQLRRWFLWLEWRGVRSRLESP